SRSPSRITRGMRFLFALGCGLRWRGARNLTLRLILYALLQHRDVGAVTREPERHRGLPLKTEHIAVGMVHGDALEDFRWPAVPLRVGLILDTDRYVGLRRLA